MKMHWKLIVKDGIISGLLFCWVIMLVLRTNILMLLGDLPAGMQEEIKALPFVREVKPYDVFLMASPMLVLVFWRSFRFLNKAGGIRGPEKGKSFWKYYLHTLLWFSIISATDLVFLDWFVYATLHIPALGVEHLLSENAVREFQSYRFHLKEHFLRPEAYAANLIIPAVLVLAYLLYRRISQPELRQKSSLRDKQGG